MELFEFSLGLISAVIVIIFGFFIKDYLEKINESKKFKRKIDRIAGKNSIILYPSPTTSTWELFKIIEIDKTGIIIKNDFETIYVPVKKLISTDIILPKENYIFLKDAYQKKKMMEVIDMMSEEILPRMMPKLMETFEEMFEEDDSNVSIALGVKIEKLIKEEGLKIVKDENSNGPSLPKYKNKDAPIG